MKKNILIILTASIMFSSNANADFSYNNAFTSSGLLSFGNYHYRTNISTSMHTVSINPPKFSAGCGGIDIGLGGIAFINFSELVRNLKAIMKNAAGYAFKLALSTFCKECEAILNDLQAIANMINSLNMDSCAAAERLVNAAADELGFNQQDGGGQSYSSDMAKWVGNARESVSNWINKLNGNDGDKLYSGVGSVVYQTFSQKGFQFDKSSKYEQTRAFMTALMGDIIGSLQNTNSEDVQLTISATQPVSDLDNIIEAIANSKGIGNKEVTVFEEAGSDNVVSEKSVQLDFSLFKANGTSGNKTLFEYYKNEISNIIMDVSGGKDITQDQYDILKQAPFELISAVNALAIIYRTEGNITAHVETVSKYYASYVVLAYINDVFDYAIRKLNKTITRNDKPLEKEMKEELSKLIKQATNARSKIGDKIKANLTGMADKAQKLQVDVENALREQRKKSLSGAN